MQPLLEICCGDIDSVKASAEGGADRVELCSALSAGGLTPSAGFIKAAVALKSNLKVNVLIRPREGDFLYSQTELGIMLSDIETAKELGADGVVIGALNADGSIDLHSCEKMIAAARPMTVTFHRAFDVCSNPQTALEQLIDLGIDTVLTSGCAQNASKGSGTLRLLRQQAADRIAILGGSGVSAENAATLIGMTGLRQLHASARTPRQSLMQYRNESVNMGTPGTDEYTRMVSDRNIIESLSQTVHQSTRP